MNANDLKIKDIPAEQIKEALLQSNIDSPLESMVSIGQNTFTIIANLKEGQTIDNELISSFSDLESHYKFYAKLLGF